MTKVCFTKSTVRGARAGVKFYPTNQPTNISGVRIISSPKGRTTTMAATITLATA
jgi:hypothetical protein